MVDVLVNLFSISVLLEESTEDTSSAHGENVVGHTGLLAPLSVTSALMTSLSLLSFMSVDSGARMHGNLASHDKTILEELSNVLACRKFIIKFCNWKSEHTKSTTG